MATATRKNLRGFLPVIVGDRRPSRLVVILAGSAWSDRHVFVLVHLGVPARARARDPHVCPRRRSHVRSDRLRKVPLPAHHYDQATAVQLAHALNGAVLAMVLTGLAVLPQRSWAPPSNQSERPSANRLRLIAQDDSVGITETRPATVGPRAVNTC